MFRVIYEWLVPQENLEEFKIVWARTTDSIHQSINGAMGSVMLQASDNSLRIFTIAKWKSKEDWEVFFENRNPQKMLEMRQLAERISVQSFYEIEDRTR